jgi:L,D-transpeptidase YcbB
MQRVRKVILALALIGLSAPAFGEEPASDAATTAPAAVPPETANPAATPAAPASQSKLKDLIATRLAQVVDHKPEQTAAEAFYRARAFQPIWSENGVALPRARAASEYLAKVASEGLDPRDYPTPDFSRDMDAQTAAANDLQLTAAILKYARHASAGRVSFTRVSGAILYPTHAADPAQVLAQVSTAENIGDVLAWFEPQHPGFKALQAQLAKALSAPESQKTASQPENSKTHRKADNQHGRSDISGTLIANMERWRWLPRDLGNAYVMVNVPDYNLSVMDKGKQIWRTRIVVGKPGEMATPLLSETMKYLTINPTWNVPPSIIRNEYLPVLERDPDALERIGLKVTTIATARSASIIRPESAMRSDASASISPTRSWSISTTRRKNTCLLRTSAHLATAACASNRRSNMPKFSWRCRSPMRDTRRRGSRACMATKNARST